MQVVLKVVGGKNDGREIVISVPRFIIGRGESAHLRPSSDLISREHCSISIKDGQVTIDDLGSRNGTFVNGSELSGTHLVKSGDSLRVGRLQFSVLIDPVKAGQKKPRVKSAVEAASRTMEKKPPSKEMIEDSITDWLSSPDEEDAKDNFRKAETVQFEIEHSKTKENLDLSDSSDQVEDSLTEDGADESEGAKRGKKKFGKLPPRPKFSHDDSTTAAGDVLKQFFNRR
ncbi:MAG: FHA domain-containing protein [Planctomycetota bacterium]|nr:FHA domain-containing protein [Planctomycetota bacterium]